MQFTVFNNNLLISIKSPLLRLKISCFINKAQFNLHKWLSLYTSHLFFVTVEGPYILPCFNPCTLPPLPNGILASKVHPNNQINLSITTSQGLTDKVLNKISNNSLKPTA